MKFIILTCLLAVALAKQRIEQYSSSEESMDNSQEDFKQDTDVVIFPNQETVKNIPIPQMNKCYQSIQKFKPPQALKGLYQYHMAKNPWGYTVNRAFPSTRTLVSDSISQQQYNQKTMGLSMRAREKIVMSEIKKNIQDYVLSSPYNHPNTLSLLDTAEILVHVDDSKQNIGRMFISHELFEFPMQGVLSVNSFYKTKMKQYSKITWPQFVKSLQQYQKTMIPWSYYPYTLLQV